MARLAQVRYMMSADPRGTSTQRGYGTHHMKLRKQIKPLVDAGQATCWRCGQPIQPGQPWHLGHNDQRTGYNGPEHQACNVRAANYRMAGKGKKTAKAIKAFFG